MDVGYLVFYLLTIAIPGSHIRNHQSIVFLIVQTQICGHARPPFTATRLQNMAWSHRVPLVIKLYDPWTAVPYHPTLIVLGFDGLSEYGRWPPVMKHG